jgi:hypothetical protein
MDEMAWSKSFAGANKTEENDENSFERNRGYTRCFSSSLLVL